MPDYIVEACVESLREAVLAEQFGADRIELCARLDLDGLTPSKELIKQVAEQVSIPVNVIIRPRAGNFLYSKKEIGEMASCIEFCKSIPVNGVVFGVLDDRNYLDLKAIGFLAKKASPLEITIHKAIDLVPDPVEAVKQLMVFPAICGILTSGQAKTAIEGAPLLREMIKTAGGRLTIIAAGKITRGNLSEVHNLIGTKAYHGRKIVGNLNI